jgi:hypothetical protein
MLGAGGSRERVKVGPSEFTECDDERNYTHVVARSRRDARLSTKESPVLFYFLVGGLLTVGDDLLSNQTSGTHCEDTEDVVGIIIM